MKVSALFQLPRCTYHRGDLPKDLKKLALEMIAEQGVEGFSLRRAAARLCVTPSAIYRHFADKSQLLNALARDGFDAMGALWLQRLALLEPLLGGKPVLRSLANFSAGADAYFQFGLDHPALFQMMFGPFGTGALTWVAPPTDKPPHPHAMLGQALDGLCEGKVITENARAGAEVSAFAAIHGLTCLAVSGAFKGLSEAQKWQRLDLVKNNVLGGLMAWDEARKLAAELHRELQPGLLGSPLPRV
jgi:hypothetical protein